MPIVYSVKVLISERTCLSARAPHPSRKIVASAGWLHLCSGLGQLHPDLVRGGRGDLVGDSAGETWVFLELVKVVKVLELPACCWWEEGVCACARFQQMVVSVSHTPFCITPSNDANDDVTLSMLVVITKTTSFIVSPVQFNFRASWNLSGMNLSVHRCPTTLLASYKLIPPHCVTMVAAAGSGC